MMPMMTEETNTAEEVLVMSMAMVSVALAMAKSREMSVV
jgi:hypothetical protein